MTYKFYRKNWVGCNCDLNRLSSAGVMAIKRTKKDAQELIEIEFSKLDKTGLPAGEISEIKLALLTMKHKGLLL